MEVIRKQPCSNSHVVSTTFSCSNAPLIIITKIMACIYTLTSQHLLTFPMDKNIKRILPQTDISFITSSVVADKIYPGYCKSCLTYVNLVQQKCFNIET